VAGAAKIGGQYTAQVSSSNRRQRALARQKFQRQQQRRADTAARRRTRQRIIGIAVVVTLTVGAVTWVVIGRSSTDTVAEPAASASAAPSSSASAPASPSPSEASPSPEASPAASSSGASIEAATVSCAAPGAARPDNLSYASAPPVTPNAGATLTLDTNCGSIVIQTLPAEAPATVASELFLAKEGFYDLTSCHRLTTAGIYVLQCGDPKGNGTGGPGYSVPDENLPAEGSDNYPAGTVAMANAGPGTAGSQFFIVYQNTTLPAGYTIWGKVVQGLDIVQGIAAAGVQGGGSDGPPAQPVFITQAIVTPR